MDRCETCRFWRGPDAADRTASGFGRCLRANEPPPSLAYRGARAKGCGADGRQGLLRTTKTFGCVDHEFWYLQAGSVITCENGHEVCDVVRLIRIGDTLHAAHFGPPRPGQAPLVEGREMAPCRCGGRYWSAAGGLHTKRGWIPRCD